MASFDFAQMGGVPQAPKQQEEVYPPAITAALEMGFSLDDAVEALSIVGDNPDNVLNFLMQRSA
jgi:uncharacterized UBP type Zn finger protein